MAALARIDDMNHIIASKAPVLAPQQYPLTSALASGARDAHGCTAGLFHARHRKAVAASLADRQRRAARSMGCAAHLVVMVAVDLQRRALMVHGLQFVSEVEAVLYDAKRFLNMELASRDGAELEPYVAHFRAKNGYGRGRGNDSAMVVQDVYNAAYSLSVLLDNIPGWVTLVRAAGGGGDSGSVTMRAPLSDALDAEATLDVLFAEPAAPPVKSSAKRGLSSGSSLSSSSSSSSSLSTSSSSSSSLTQSAVSAKKKKKTASSSASSTKTPQISPSFEQKSTVEATPSSKKKKKRSRAAPDS